MASRVVIAPTVVLRHAGGRWLVSDLLHKKRYAVATEVAMLLVACASPTRVEDAIATVAERFGEGCVPRLRAGLSSLRQKDLVIHESAWASDGWRALIADWMKYGWREAALHHMAAWDYPFVYYDGEGREVDRTTMRIYGALEPDEDRTKAYLPANSGYAAPRPQEALSQQTFAAVLEGSVPPQRLTLDCLLRILSGAFGKIAEFPTGNLRRTSPSGGARHPTEAFVLPVGLQGISGWHHFAVGLNELQPVPRSAVTPWQDRLFGLTRASFQPKTIVTLVSRFDRNMYRYREPRTFRTIFMDAGHLVTSVQAIARSEGIRTFAHTGLDDLGLERDLALRGLGEGVIAAVAFGDGA